MATVDTSHVQRTPRLPQTTLRHFGLFDLKAADLDAAYEPERAAGDYDYEGTRMADDLFGYSEGPYRRRDAANVTKYFTDGLLMTVAGSLFKRIERHIPYPKALVAMHNCSGTDRYIPYTRGGYVVDAWRKGKIRNWGWLAGNFY